MGLNVLSGSELRHVRRTGAAQHLVREVLDPGLLPHLLEHAKEESC